MAAVEVSGENLHLELILRVVERVLGRVVEADGVGLPVDNVARGALGGLGCVDAAKVPKRGVDVLVDAEPRHIARGKVGQQRETPICPVSCIVVFVRAIGANEVLVGDIDWGLDVVGHIAAGEVPVCAVEVVVPRAIGGRGHWGLCLGQPGQSGTQENEIAAEGTILSHL